jgi:DNA-binding NarL/FixJ family response regulator
VDVALVDYRLRDGTGVDAIHAIKAVRPECRIVMLTALDDEDIVFESIQAGADGYLTKDRAVDDVVSTVRAARLGATLLPRSVIVAIARRVAEGRDREAERLPGEGLTPRELEVLRTLTEGLATPEVCERMGISPNTLRTHVQNIMAKLGVHSKLEAVAFGLRHGLVAPPRVD